MTKAMFKLLAAFNKLVLPSMAREDLTRLTKLKKALVAYRYWVTTRALD
jgi:hypothetical protein